MHQRYEGSFLPFSTNWDARPIITKYRRADLLPVDSQLGEHEGPLSG